ncbi:ATP-dependent helicase [Paenibacillus silvae]|uniref:ATP-dependent helicase n=1 Tax=Paenibacillus silvae TaxID=1325358 RepID=UPI0020069B1D|nr:ATP-dependent helicase [Paenibacillus silvae]MCK6075363.1 ATP-dependent helicase [Paenibacillus silvae]MCK6149750.1 ATP-dependent helicase [Paenibacillus silvae]MCK6268048.1 ATP-dependent helicase [Paenibacillus silvae]
MPLRKLLNKLTDRDKLVSEIETLSLSNQRMHEVNLVLQNKLAVKTTEIEQLLNDNKKLQAYILKNESEMQELRLLIGRVVESNEIYKNQYGEVTSSTNEKLIGEWDVDKNFFDHIEQIKGNPFNQHQVEAIRYPMERSLRIIAGAGSGKTETICAKTAYLTTMENVEASKICMVTFTRKAADEMNDRVNLFLGTDNSKVMIGTFHGVFRSLFEQLLRIIPALASVGVTGQKEDDSDEKASKLFQQLIEKYNLFVFDKQENKNIRQRIDYWTNLGYSPEEMMAFVAKHYDSLESESEYPIHKRFYDLYMEFIQIRTEQQIVIFDDFLLNLYRALQQYESARKFIQNKFEYIFVDEFQDINPLQMDILKLISPPDGSGAKLIIVGDDDQSIYAFRGSDPKFIKQFHELYNTYTIELMMNYRSKQNIVQAGNRVIISNAHDRIKKSMTPFHNAEGDAYIWAANNPVDEANWIISKAQKLGEEKQFEFKDKVEIVNYTLSTILYRSVGQLQSVYQVLDHRSIPYVIENNADVMGIFNISELKKAFGIWSNLMKANALIQSNWRPLLINIANAYYIKSQEVDHFLVQNDFSNVQHMLRKFVEYVKKYNKGNDIVLLENYLNGIFKLIKRNQVDIMEFIEPLLLFPTNKKNLSKEETDWIKKECTIYKSWRDLNGYHQRLKEKSENMKKHLELYHKGEYNALYFLTIHKSKGLAFNNVFVIGVHDGALPSNRAVALSSVDMNECKEKAEPPTTHEEERRLMYVAATRAKNNLYVTFPKTIQDKPSKRSIFIKELRMQLKNG